MSELDGIEEGVVDGENEGARAHPDEMAGDSKKRMWTFEVAGIQSRVLRCGIRAVRGVIIDNRKLMRKPERAMHGWNVAGTRQGR